MSEGDYLDLAAQCVERAVGLGAEWCDVAAGRSRDIEVIIEKTGIRAADAGQGESVAIRCFISGGMGYASVSGRHPPDVDEAVDRAVALARQAAADPDFRRLPPPQDAPPVPGLFDDAVAGMSVEDVVRIAAENIERARAMEPDVRLAGDVGLTVSEGALASSAGVRLIRRTTRIDASIEATLRRGDDVGYFYDFDYGRLLEDTRLGAISESAVAGARRFLGARRVASRRMTLLLGPLASHGLVASLVEAADAESIQRGRSFLCGRLHEPIAAGCLTIVDDGTVPRGMSSGSHDGEGTPRRPLAVVEGGVLAGLLHNAYTAGKAAAESTGHGTHSGGIRPTNLLPRLGDRSAAELLAEVDEGIYLEAGELAPDPASGDISASIDFGFYVRRGRIEHPVEAAMIGTNILDLLASLDAVSCDARTEPGAIMPALRIPDMQVAGAA